MRPKLVPIGSFAPDLSKYMPGHCDTLLNVMPTLDGYAPLRKFSSYGSGLPSACLGAITVRTTDGNFEFYAGTATKLYKYNVGASSFDDITRLSGGDYAVPTGFKWNFHQFGNLLYAVNGADDNQSINVDSGANFATAGGSPPIARYVDSVNEFLVLIGLTGDWSSIAWSGIGNSEYWEFGQRGSGKQELAGGGELVGFVGHETGGIVLQRSKMRAMVFTPTSPYTFSFSTIQNNIGAIGEPSIARFRNTFYFISDSGFYEGVDAIPIGGEVINRYLLSNADLTVLHESQGTIDPVNKMAWWIIVKTDASVEMLGYHWILKKWTRANMDATYLVSAATPGYTLESLDVFGTLETLAYPLDSRVWSGGAVGLAGFSDTGDFGFFEGNKLEATVETNDQVINPGGSGFVQGARLIIDTDETNYTGKIGGRAHSGEPIEWNSMVTPAPQNGQIISRKTARSHRAHFVVPEDTAWTKINGVEFVTAGAGNR